MQRKFPRLYGSRAIDAPYRRLEVLLISSTSHNLAMHSEEVKAAICSPPCTCADCEQGYYTCEEQMHPGWFYRRSLSSDEAKQIAASYINVIQRDREYLMDSLAKYGNIIVSRWKKKSQDKRQALLLEAIPNLCKKRWIIPRHGFTPEGKEIPPINSDGQMELRSLETRNHLLLNWLDLEVLKTNPAVLFALLHNRTAYAPQDWASFDSRQIYSPFLCPHFDVDFSAKCIAMYGLRILQAIESCWRWGWVKNECERVKSIHDRFRDNIAQGEDLPSRYDKALSALELLVVNDVNRRGALLGSTTPQQPGFSHRYLAKREAQKQGPDIIEWRRKDGLLSDAKHMFENDPLDYCLFQLQARPDIQQKQNTWPKEVSIDHALLFSILEDHLAKSNIKEKSRLDEVLSNLLSDLATSHEMLAAIRLHRPLSRPRTLDEVLQSESEKLGGPLMKALEAFWQGIRKDSLMVWKQNGFTEDEAIEEIEYISATTTQEYLSATQAE
ncbi:uncharacterized protein EAE97_006551 [Botrytis byssoidea]|uniref:Uncharacterized protein n=1 Tax=Botrytis byssoidea TaxID=139641 RepID=A0A9P5LU44_9HELO|nr:uncharacterized protein EAE97_006551 [Botrytis byssoidea]KAF7941714.1 hypothetical protein EAE97_006551 [Botrytis byssoidea]